MLFVDDDAIARRAFARAMRRQGFIVDVAANAEEALELAEQYAYAVVATDQCMPGLAGSDLVERLRQVHPESTYVIVTGDHRFVAESDDYGKRQLVIYKPWSDGDVGLLLKEATERFLQRRQQQGRQTVPAPSRAGLPILLLEDSAAVAHQVSGMIEEASPGEFRLVHADTLGGALKLLENQSYAAVLVDLNLPDSEGLATVERLHGAAQGTPLVVLGSTEGDSVSLRAVQRGAQDYLVKDELDGRRLLRALRYAIERKQIERRLERLAHYDQLTGLVNRSMLRLELRQALMRGAMRGVRTALLVIDLHRFKSVNDSLGHDAGDLLLKEVACRLLGSVREFDTVGRLGGDEFAIVLGDVSSDQEVLRTAERVLNSFATPMRVLDRDVWVTLSIGIAIAPDNADAEELLLKHAGSALARAKEHGFNRYRFFSEELHGRAVQRMQVETELARAIAEHEFILHYQPEFTADGSQRAVAVEALIRWQHPADGLLPPAVFIPILEDTGQIVEVGEWLLQASLAQLRRWTDAGLDELRLAVNLSPRQFADDGLVATIRQALLDWNIPGDRLELEITEGVLIRDTDAAKRTLRALADLGVRIAIDDFGTGYSSVAQLKQLPIHALKIDRSFVNDAPGDSDHAAIVAATLALGRALGLDVIAEGVETMAQVELLKQHGCRIIQGHLVGVPRPATEAAEIFAAPNMV